MPSFRGANIFGTAVRIRHTPNQNAQQSNSFFGVTGMQTLFGGGRGRAFQVSGLFVGNTENDVVIAEQNLLSYADGIAGDFVDNYGVTYSNVIFDGVYQQDDNGIKPIVSGAFAGGFARGYSMVLRGLQ